MPPPPARSPRVRRDPATARALILDTAAAIMRDEGHAAVSLRRIARQAGISSALVHYYYPTTDDLFVALHRALSAAQDESLNMALSSPAPIRALWEEQSSWAGASLGVELVAIASHRPAVTAEIAQRAMQTREAQIARIAAIGLPATLDPVLTPACVVTALIALARLLANEEVIGMTTGHADIRALVGWALDRVEPDTGLT